MPARLIAFGTVVLCVAIGAWFLGDSASRDRNAKVERSLTIGPPPAPARQAVRPAMRIPENGRLTTRRATLRDGEVLALGLDLSDEDRGAEPTRVKVIDAGLRVYETFATPLPGERAGLRLEIDPAWLGPSRYMIQVETHGSGPLAVQRYFLEVLD